MMTLVPLFSESILSMTFFSKPRCSKEEILRAGTPWQQRLQAESSRLKDEAFGRFTRGFPDSATTSTWGRGTTGRAWALIQTPEFLSHTRSVLGSLYS